MEVVWFVETIAEVTKDDRISRKGAAMFEKRCLKKRWSDNLFFSIRRQTIKAVQVRGSLREGQRDMKNFNCSVGERRGRGPGRARKEPV